MQALPVRIQCCQSPVPVPASVAMWVIVREQGPACQLRRVDSRRPQLHAVWLGRRLFCVGRVPPGVIRRVEKVCSLALELAQLHTCACAHCCVCHARAKVQASPAGLLSLSSDAEALAAAARPCYKCRKSSLQHLSDQERMITSRVLPPADPVEAASRISQGALGTRRSLDPTHGQLDGL